MGKAKYSALQNEEEDDVELQDDDGVSNSQTMSNLRHHLTLGSPSTFEMFSNNFSFLEHDN
jgi:hypothetical protein